MGFKTFRDLLLHAAKKSIIKVIAGESNDGDLLFTYNTPASSFKKPSVKYGVENVIEPQFKQLVDFMSTKRCDTKFRQSWVEKMVSM
jgi:hypothetical protein